MTDIVIAPKVQQCLWSAISSIPGCQMDAEVVAEESHNNEIQYRLAITGWSPSLHKLTMNWHSDWTPIVVRSDKEEVEYILEQFDLQLNIQKERAARSLNAKRAFPCEISKTKRSLYNNNADIQDHHQGAENEHLVHRPACPDRQ